MPRNPIDKNVAIVSNALKNISPQMVAEIVDGIGSSNDPAVVARVVAAVYKKYQVKQVLTDAMLKGLTGSLAAGARLKISDIPVKSVKVWYLEKAYMADGKKFKPSINDLSRTTEIVGTVRRGMQAGNSWRKIAQDMRDKNIQVGDVAKDVQGLIDAARKSYALTGDVKGYGSYKREIEAVKKRIAKLVDPNTSKLKAAYSEFVKLTDGASAEAVERAAKYAIYHKQKYNAERIARTEMARAYGQAAHTEMHYDDGVIGWQAVLSSNHSVTDICDFHTSVDLYGMGSGVYPKGHGPELPFHCQCKCLIDPVYSGETDAKKPKDYSATGGEKFLKSATEKERRALLGVEGAEEFDKKPKTWASNLKNWNGNTPQPATIPKEVLYGG
jgi:hypothetical protein